MATAVMGRTRSPQADAIRDLYFTEHADSMRRITQRDGSVRVALFREGAGTDPVSVWLVLPDGCVRQAGA